MSREESKEEAKAKNDGPVDQASASLEQFSDCSAEVPAEQEEGQNFVYRPIEYDETYHEAALLKKK